MRPGKRSAVFTIVSANYISYAATLMQSVRKHHPNVARYIILSDVAHRFPDIDLAANIVACNELGFDRIRNMKIWYSVIEFNTSIKPYVFDWLFQKQGFQECLYIDPDIRLYSPLHEVFQGLSEHNIVLTPHIMAPLQDGAEPSDITIMKSGIYNLGFLGARRDIHTESLINWWCDRLYLHCRVSISEHMFTDQRWMDLAPVFVPNPLILRHPGYNVAYWNLAQRRIGQLRTGKWTVEGGPLRFFHFSGIKPSDPESFSKHQNRFTVDNLGSVADLCREYRELVLSNGWLSTTKIPYGFSDFPGGRVIDDFSRRCILRAVDQGQLESDRTLEIGCDFLEELEPIDINKDGTLTRYAYQVWLDRKDLQKAFDLGSEHGLARYNEWFCAGGGEKDGIDPYHIGVAQKLQHKEGDAQTKRQRPSVGSCPPPWASVARDCWSGNASGVGTWLRETVPFSIDGVSCSLPRFALLLWERRSDLQPVFDMRTPESVDVFLAWLITDGITDGSVREYMFSSEFLNQLEARSDISLYYDDVPITRGMLTLRNDLRGRTGLGAFTRFPFDKQARLEHGLWFALVAPKLFGWPEALGRGARQHFHAHTHIGIGRFKFTTAMITLWELRPDLQRVYPLTTLASKRALLRWFIFHMGRDYDLSPDELHPRLVPFLESPSWYGLEISVLLGLVYEERPDLQQAFDLNANEGRTKFRLWASDHLIDYLIERRLASLARKLGLSAEDSDTDSEKSVVASVAVVGHWERPSGIGEDLRASVAAFAACRFTDFVVVDFDTGQILDPDGMPLPHVRSVRVKDCIVHRNADTAADDWRILTDLGIAAERWIGHWAWELECMPSYWRHAFSFYDEIWAATEFARGAFDKEQLRRVKLVPNPVIVPEIRVGKKSKSVLSLPRARTRFLFMFDFSSLFARKNPLALIRAFTTAFPDRSEDVQLVLKTQNASTAQEAAHKLLEAVQDQRIIIRNEVLSREHVIELIRSSDAFVSLHRSEGFGRGPAEAMLLCRPVVVTNYSGTVDYADETCSLPVGFQMVAVKEDEYVGVEGQCWAEANIDDAARALRWIHENPSQARSVAKRGQRRVADLYSPKIVGLRMLAALEQSRPDNTGKAATLINETSEMHRAVI